MRRRAPSPRRPVPTRGRCDCARGHGAASLRNRRLDWPPDGAAIERTETLERSPVREMPARPNRWVRIASAATVAVVVLMVWLAAGSIRPTPDTAIAYSRFLDLVRAGKIASVVLQGDVVTGRVAHGAPFHTYLPTGDTSALAMLEAKDATITVAPPARPSAFAWLMALLGVCLLFGMAWWTAHQRSTGGPEILSFGKSRARRHTEAEMRVTFDDVAGVEEAKEELAEIAEFLRSPTKFQELGAKIPRGILLVGPPGSGKTLLAKAIAGEAKAPFLSISGSEFVEMFVGVGASRIRHLFDQAKKLSPCLVFIDEIDAAGRRRGAGLGAGHDEREQTLNQLLVEMDGFDPNSGIIVIAATNRPDILDPALLRPGRFDRRIVVDHPDSRGRRAILDVHARGKPIALEVNLDQVAQRTPGFSGAELANTVNEAALLAVRRGKNRISRAEFDEAIERVIGGPQRKSRILSPHERRLTAFHEGGHALLAKLLPAANPPYRVTIVPRGMALGAVMLLPQEEKQTRTRDEILSNITAMLGGRVAEEVTFGEITTGAASDFQQATDLARRMVTEFGMSERLGPLALGTRQGSAFLGRASGESRNYSDEIACEIDREVRRIIDECYRRARQVLTQHRAVLERIAAALLARESLDGEELDDLVRGVSNAASA